MDTLYVLQILPVGMGVEGTCLIFQVPKSSGLYLALFLLLNWPENSPERWVYKNILRLLKCES